MEIRIKTISEMKVVLFILILVCIAVLCWMCYCTGFKDGVKGALERIEEKLKEEEEQDEHLH